jgi:DNA-binding NtrC family response regulator
MPEPAILIVDDEKNIRLTLSRSLEELGRPVMSAVNGEDALRQLAEHDVGVMLLDLKMPGMDGMEVLRRVAESRPEVRVVIVTAHGDVPNSVEAMKLGAVDFMQKPFSPDEVRAVVRGLVDREAVEGERAQSYEEHLALAKRAVNERHLKSAIAHARQAIARDAGRAEAFNLLGALLEITGDRRGAQQQYRIALQVDPTSKAAASNLERATSGRWRGEMGPPELE